MRNLSILSCLVALIVSSGCQSSGFRNPFKEQIARSFPDSSPELKTKSKEQRDEPADSDQNVSSEASSQVGRRPVSDVEGAADRRTGPHARTISNDLTQGDAAFAQGDLSKAEELYQDAVKLDPQNVHAHHRLAIINDLRENYAVSEKHYETALQHDRENLALLNDLGYSYFLQQRFEDSKAYFEYILQIDKSHQRAMQNLALVHAAEGDLQQAYALFQQGGLNHEQAQQRIQGVVARRSESEGRATTHQSRMGLASTRNEQPGEASTESIATVSMSEERSLPGHTDLRSVRKDTFQPKPDWESTYGMKPNNQNTTLSHSDRSARPSPQVTAHRSPPETHENPMGGMDQPQVNPVIQQASYTPEADSSTTPSSRQAALIRTALNLGYGNLFPAIGPEEYYGIQRVNATVDVGQPDARNAYYEQFGQPDSRTPHVVHATNYQVSGEGLTETESRPTYNATRIQTPNYESIPRESTASQIPSNSFPVTQAVQRTSAAHDYSRFPNSERPPLEESAGVSSQELKQILEKPVVFKPRTPGSDQQGSGVMIVPKSGTSNDHDHEAGPDYAVPVDRGYSESHSNSYDDGPRISPMPESSQRAHELALERLRQAQQ